MGKYEELAAFQGEDIEDIELGNPVRVLDESDTKVFRCTGTVLDKDKNESFVWTNPVKVTDSCDRSVGCVVLSDNDGTDIFVEGEFFLDYYTPERLNLETREHSMYPRVYTKLIDAEDQLFEITKISLIETRVGEPL